MDYSQVEEQFQTLKQQFTAGKLDEPAFKARLNELMVQDGQGRWWMIGYETGQWYTHDGSAWVRAEPPARRSAPPAKSSPLPEKSAQETPSPAKEVKKLGFTFWAGWIGSLAVGVIIVVLLEGILRNASVAGLFLGAIAGTLQWLIIRRYSQHSGYWILANMFILGLIGQWVDTYGDTFLFIALLLIYLLADLIVGPVLVARWRRMGAGG